MHHERMNRSDLLNTRQIIRRGLSLDIALLKTESLIVHEEIIPIRFNKLKKQIERDGFQLAPVLVDRNTLVVLDGMHRTAIMKELGTQFICVCLLDYFNPGIKVQRWCRLIPGPFTEEIAAELLGSIGFSLKPYEVVDRIDEVKGPFLRFRESVYRLVSDEDDVMKTFKKISNLELKLLKNRYDIRYCTEFEVDGYLNSGKYEAVLYPPKLKKQQVLDAATNNKIFPPKATRHTLPAMLVDVNAPLSLLSNNEISLKEANKRLAKILNIEDVKR